MDDVKVPHTGSQIVDFSTGRTTLETALDSIRNDTRYTLFLSTREWEWFVTAIDAALAQARAEEREACAKIAEGYDMPCPPRTDAEQVAHDIYTAIRARTP